MGVFLNRQRGRNTDKKQSIIPQYVIYNMYCINCYQEQWINKTAECSNYLNRNEKGNYQHQLEDLIRKRDTQEIQKGNFISKNGQFLGISQNQPDNSNLNDWSSNIQKQQKQNLTRERPIQSAKELVQYNVTSQQNDNRIASLHPLLADQHSQVILFEKRLEKDNQMCNQLKIKDGIIEKIQLQLDEKYRQLKESQENEQNLQNKIIEMNQIAQNSAYEWKLLHVENKKLQRSLQVAEQAAEIKTQFNYELGKQVKQYQYKIQEQEGTISKFFNQSQNQMDAINNLKYQLQTLSEKEDKSSKDFKYTSQKIQQQALYLEESKKIIDDQVKQLIGLIANQDSYQKEVGQLKGKNISLQVEIKKISSTNQGLLEQLEDKTDEITELQQTMNQLQGQQKENKKIFDIQSKELIESKSIQDSYKKEASHLKEQIVSLEENLSNSSSANQDLQEQLLDKISEISKLHETINQLQKQQQQSLKEIDIKQKELIDSKQIQDLYQKEGIELKQVIVSLQEQRKNSSSKTNQGLQEQQQDNIHEITKLNETINQLQEQQEQSLKEIDIKQKELIDSIQIQDSYQKKIIELKQIIGSLQEQIKNCSSTNQVFSEQLQDNIQEITKLNETINQLQEQQQQNKQKQLIDSKQIQDSYQREVIELKCTIVSLQEQVKNSSSTNYGKQEQLQDKIDEISKLHETINQLQEQQKQQISVVDLKSQQLIDSNSIQASYLKEKIESKETTASLKEQLNNFSSINEDLQKQIEDKMNEISRLNENFSQLQEQQKQNLKLIDNPSGQLIDSKSIQSSCKEQVAQLKQINASLQEELNNSSSLNEDLQEQIQDKNSEICKLNEIINQLNGSQEQNMKEINIQAQQLIDSKSNQSSYQQQATQLKQANVSLQEQLNNFSSIKQGLQGQLQGKIDEISKLNETINQLEGQQKKDMKVINIQSKQLIDFKSIQDSYQKEAIEAKETIASLKEQLNNSSSINEDLQNQFQGTKNEISRLNETLNQLQEQLKQNQKLIDIQSGQLIDSKSIQSSYMEQVAQLKQIIASLQEELNNSSSLNEDLQEQIQDKNSKICKLNEIINQLNGSQEQNMKEINIQAQQLIDSKSNQSSYQQQATQLKQANVSLQEQLNNFSSIKQGLQGQLQIKIDEISKLNETMNEFEGQKKKDKTVINIQSKQLIESQSIQDTYQKETLKLKQTIASLREQLTNYSTTNQGLNEQLQEQNEEISKLNDTLNQLQRQQEQNLKVIDIKSKQSIKSESIQSSYQEQVAQLKQTNVSLQKQLTDSLSIIGGLKQQLLDKTNQISQSDENLNQIYQQWGENMNQTISQKVQEVTELKEKTYQESQAIIEANTQEIQFLNQQYQEQTAKLILITGQLNQFQFDVKKEVLAPYIEAIRVCSECNQSVPSIGHFSGKDLCLSCYQDYLQEFY